MKRLSLFTGGAVVLLASLSFAGAKPAQAATVNIVFDGYCDGMSLNIPSAGSGLPGTVDGNHTGSCVTNYGDIGYKAGSTIGTAENEDGTLVVYVLKTDHTWSNYYDCTGTGIECYYLSGTWSFGTPAAPDKKRTSISTVPRQ